MKHGESRGTALASANFASLQPVYGGSKKVSASSSDAVTGKHSIHLTNGTARIGDGNGSP